MSFIHSLRKNKDRIDTVVVRVLVLIPISVQVTLHLL